MEQYGAPPGLLVDRNGIPRVFYHGTNVGFSEFDPGKVHDKEGLSLKLGMGPGMLYFTDDPRDAARYATRWSKDGSGANIHAVHLLMGKPFIVKGRNRGWFEAARDGRDEYGDTQRLRRSYAERMKRFVRDLKAEGYDGIIHPEQAPVDDGCVKMNGTPGEYIVFGPSQVVSAIGYSYRRDFLAGPDEPYWEKSEDEEATCHAFR